jgi:hypothetical protein
MAGFLCSFATSGVDDTRDLEFHVGEKMGAKFFLFLLTEKEVFLQLDGDEKKKAQKIVESKNLRWFDGSPVKRLFPRNSRAEAALMALILAEWDNFTIS